MSINSFCRLSVLGAQTVFTENWIPSVFETRGYLQNWKDAYTEGKSSLFCNQLPHLACKIIYFDT